MKRIDAMVPTLRRTSVVESILGAGAKGVTLSENRGKGSGKREMVHCIFRENAWLGTTNSCVKQNYLLPEFYCLFQL